MAITFCTLRSVCFKLIQGSRCSYNSLTYLTTHDCDLDLEDDLVLRSNNNDSYTKRALLLMKEYEHCYRICCFDFIILLYSYSTTEVNAISLACEGLHVYMTDNLYFKHVSWICKLHTDHGP